MGRISLAASFEDVPGERGQVERVSLLGGREDVEPEVEDEVLFAAATSCALRRPTAAAAAAAARAEADHD